MFQQLKHPQTATELKRPLGNVSFQENVRGGKKKISVDDDKKKKTTGCGANIRVSGHMFLCSVLSRYKVLLIDVKDNEYVYFLNAFLKKEKKKIMI